MIKNMAYGYSVNKRFLKNDRISRNTGTESPAGPWASETQQQAARLTPRGPRSVLSITQRWVGHAPKMVVLFPRLSQLFLLLWLRNLIVSKLVKCKYKKGRIMVSTKISTRYYKGLERWLANRHTGMPILTSFSPKWKLLSKPLKCFNAFWNSSSPPPAPAPQFRNNQLLTTAHGKLKHLVKKVESP